MTFYAKTEGGRVTAIVRATAAPGAGWTAIASDAIPEGGGLGKRLIVSGGVLAWANKPESEAWAAIRARRDALLLQTDWTQLPDVPAATRALWVSYRQSLRDITEQPDPFNIVWPALPA